MSVDSDREKICSICGKDYVENGHPAAPVNGGRCCNRCNDSVVIPRRIRDGRREERRGKRVAP